MSDQHADDVRGWAGLTPPYGAIVVDPPWQYEVSDENGIKRRIGGGPSGVHGWFAYSQMNLDDIKRLPVGDLTDSGRCFLWTTNRYLRHSWAVLEAWGFVPQERVLVWCKTPRGTIPVTTEFVLVGKKGAPPRMPWHNTTWFQWGHQSGHSVKPQAFLDLVESWSPGPYVELFARAPRLGWDSWGHGYEVAS